MSTAVKTDVVRFGRKWRWPLEELFRDLRVRYGIKLGLAGTLALFAAQVLRLPHDNWAILTVLVMMTAQYVGSTPVRAIMRVIGTIGGAAVGVWLVGNYTSTPMIVLPVFFLVLAITSYKYGQYGARQVPYAYYLLGLTTLSVVTNGVGSPDQAWQVGIDRTEEILLGAMIALLVSTILWPRSAREEFVAVSRESLKTVGELVSIQTEAYALGAGSPAKVEEIRQTFVTRLSVLRNLLQAGSMESTFFAARLSNYNAFLVSLISLFQGALLLTHWRSVDAVIVERLRAELELVSSAISEEVSILSGPHRPGEKLPPGSLQDAFAALVQKVEELRDEGFFAAQPLRTVIVFGTHFAGLNPQQPVPSQTIIDSFIGLMVGMFIGALVGRLIWPVLPQRLLRDNLLDLFAGIKALLREDPYPEKIQARLTIRSVEALQVIRQIRMHGCSEKEKASIGDLLRELQALVPRVGHLVSYRKNLPRASEPLLRPKLERLEIEFNQMLDAFSDGFRQGDCRREFPTLHGAVSAMDETVQEIRQSGILNEHKATKPLRMSDLVGRYHLIADNLEDCSRLIGGLRIEQYWGDYAL
jgi:uncharacterized membrane protein YccC